MDFIDDHWQLAVFFFFFIMLQQQQRLLKNFSSGGTTYPCRGSRRIPITLSLLSCMQTDDQFYRTIRFYYVVDDLLTLPFE